VETSKKYCPNCGAEVAVDAKFCDNCGAKLTSEAQTSKGKNSQDMATAGSASVVVSKRLDRWATSVTKKPE